MSLQSRFRFLAFLPVLLLLLVTGLLAIFAKKILDKPSVPPFGVFIFLVLFIFTWVWLAFGELRTKVVKIEIQGEEIMVSNYLGLGFKKIYSLSQFDGLETALLPSRYDTYEYLYLIENGKKVIKLSQFYHNNYADLKSTLINKVQNLGQKDFSLLQEVKEIFI